MNTKVELKRLAGLALRACGRPKMGRTSANSQSRRSARSIRSWVDGRALRVPRRCGAPLHHIALARKPSRDASGLLLWARATS